MQAALLLLALAAATPQKGKLLILEPTANGVDGRLTLAVTSALAEAASQVAGGRPVITMLDVKDVLVHDEVRVLASCGDEAKCRDSLKKLAGVELLIAATIGPVGKSMTLTLALLEASTAVARSRASTVVDNAEALPKAARELVAQLFNQKEGGKAERFEWKRKSASIAVFDLVASGVPNETAANLTQILAVEVKQIPGTKVIARDDIRAVLNLETQKQLLGCSDSTACLAEIAGALGVDFLLAGHVGRIAETHVVSLRLIDPTSLEVKSRVTESFIGPEDQLVGAIRFAVRNLFGFEAKEKGKLTVAAGDGAGSVFVDGAAAGAVLKPVMVSPGRHTVRIVDPDYLEWKGEVFVQPGPNALTVNLDPRARPFFTSWIFWTAVGVALAGGATAIALSARGASAADQTHPFGFEVGLPGR